MNDLLAILLFLAAWILVSRYLLPKLGIPT